jgi:predicted ABC-type transport system involved in lysophospholipase L1 biosynthesis ATPase subunit
VVTHDNSVAARCHRTLTIVDGRVHEALGATR